jgi:hypothetical protein
MKLFVISKACYFYVQAFLVICVFEKYDSILMRLTNLDRFQFLAIALMRNASSRIEGSGEEGK